MGVVKKVEVVDPVRVPGVSPAEHDDWSWMVAEDPAFYLKERGLISG